jgi:hypothetical protein
LLRRLAILVLVGVGLLMLVIATELIAGWRCRIDDQIESPAPQTPERKSATADIKDYFRPEDDTYLSYPEWYIVWSYEEKADFQKQHLPSGFPYFGAVRQYWNSYCCITRLTRGKYRFNGGEQLMLVVIGTSFSVEYILKGIYENTIGRLSEWSSGQEPVEEDHFAAGVAREYANFVHIRPFYEFHFARQIKCLWHEIPISGRHPLRKWERRAFLTTDYTIEALYCWLIEKATVATYGHEPAETYAWIQNADEHIFQQMPRMKKVVRVAPREFIVNIPRYQEFTGVAATLASQGVGFVEIAGNSHIIVSVLAPQGWRYGNGDARQLFASPILTHPEEQRVVLGCKVSSLAGVLNRLDSSGVGFEHVYDY